LPPAFEEAFIGSIPHECMLERVCRLRWGTTFEHKFRRDKLLECRQKFGLTLCADGSEHSVAELATDHSRLLGGRLGGVFGGGGSTSLFLDAEARQGLGDGWAVTLMGRRGWTDFAGGKFQTSAYAFDLSKYGLLADRDRLGLRISQPLRVETGGIAMLLPTSYDYATESETVTLERLSFTPSGREVDAELGYSSALGRGWLGANLFARRQPGHIASAGPDMGGAIRYSLGF